MAYSPDPTRATNVSLTVTSGSHVTNLTVDQTVALPAGSIVRLIGTVQLVTGEESVITVGTGGTTGFVILDAIQLVQQAPTGTSPNTFQKDGSPTSAYNFIELQDNNYLQWNAPAHIRIWNIKGILIYEESGDQGKKVQLSGQLFRALQGGRHLVNVIPFP